MQVGGGGEIRKLGTSINNVETTRRIPRFCQKKYRLINKYINKYTVYWSLCKRNARAMSPNFRKLVYAAK